MGFQPLEESKIINGAIFYDFRITGTQFPPRQRIQRANIGQNQTGLMKGAHQILSCGHINAGLAPNGAVDLGQQCGGNLYKIDSAQGNGGDETDQIPDHPAAQGNKGG